MAQEKRCLLRVEVLNKDMTVINTIEGDVIGGNITIDAESDIRRTCNLTLHISSADYYPTENSQMFLNKYIRVFVGIQVNSDDETEWIPMGIYAYSTLGYSYDSENKTLSLSGVDLMSELTGARDGNIEAQDITLEASKGTNISTVMADVLRQMTRFKEYNIDTIGSEYDTKHSNYTGASYTELPYDVSVESSPTVYNVLTSLSTIYPNWEIYFDVNGIFNCHMIPDGQFEPNVLTDDILQPLLISENINIDWQNIYNKISVWGALLEPDVAAEQEEVSIDDTETQFTLYNLDIKDTTDKSQTLADLINNQKMLSFTIPINEELSENYTLANLANGEGYYVKNDIVVQATALDASRCFVLNEYIVQDVTIKDDGTVLDKEENDITSTVTIIDSIAVKNTAIEKNINIVNGQIFNQSGQLMDGAYSITTDDGDLVAIKSEALVNAIHWGYGGNLILNGNEYLCRNGEKVVNYNDNITLMNPASQINGQGSQSSVKILVLNGYINTITLSDGTVVSENLDQKYSCIYDNFLNKYILIDRQYYTELPNDHGAFLYIPNSFILSSVSKQPAISFQGDKDGAGGNKANYCVPVFPDNETIKYNYQIEDENTDYNAPKLLPDTTYVFKYVDISNYKNLTPEQFLYYIQIFCSAYRDSISAQNITNFQTLQNELTNASKLSEEAYNKGIGYVKSSGFYAGGYFLYLGKLQIQATYSVTDPTNPFNVDNIGEIVQVYEGEENEAITSNNLALQRAKWEAYKATRLQKQLSLTCMLIPDLDVNKKISFTSRSMEMTSEYIIKNINHDLGSWTTTISAPEYFPYYEPDEKSLLLENNDFVQISVTFDTTTCVLLKGGSDVLYKYRTEPYITEVCPKPGYYFSGWRDLTTNETIETSPRLELTPVSGVLSEGSYEPICIKIETSTPYYLNFLSSDESLGTVSPSRVQSSTITSETPLSITATELTEGEFVSWTNVYDGTVLSYNKTLTLNSDSLAELDGTVLQANFRYKNYKRTLTFQRTYDENVTPTDDVGSLTSYSITIGKDNNGFDYTPADGVLTKAISDDKATFSKWIDPAGNTVSTNATLTADMFDTKTYPSGVTVDVMPDVFIAVFDEHLKNIDIFYQLKGGEPENCKLSRSYERVYNENGEFTEPLGCTAQYMPGWGGIYIHEFKHWEDLDGNIVSTNSTFDVYSEYYKDNKKNIRKSNTFKAVFVISY